MIQKFEKIEQFKGSLTLPGDKSISHRSVFFSALAKGKSKITNCLESEDLTSTMNCFKQLGCNIERKDNTIFVEGRGYRGFEKPKQNLDAGNSGTTARLISGILAVQDFETTLVGDDSLSKRPMDRIAKPLFRIGANIKLTDGKTLPAEFFPSKNLKAIEYKLPVASAQVKSAVLLAGLHLEDETIVIESIKSRDHTERMLKLPQEEIEGTKVIRVSKKNYPMPNEFFVPSDISTAAFFIVAALLAKDSEIIIKNVSLNETRTGIIEVLKNMGGNIEVIDKKVAAGEPYGDLIIRSSQLKNVEINKSIIPNIIDEIPVLSVAGVFAEGEFIVKNASELRVKESDRINSLCENYKKLGLTINEFEDGFALSGQIKNTGNLVFESYNDHRIAMTFAVLSSLIKGGGSIANFQSAAISNPRFIEQLKSIAK